MNGSNAILKAVIDTNAIFMAWYNPFGKCAEIIRRARRGKIKLFSTDNTKEEIIRVFQRHKVNWNEINEFLDNLPITWVKKDIYEKALDKTKVKHKADKPLEALSLILDCGILSADKHFKNRMNIDELLKRS